MEMFLRQSPLTRHGHERKQGCKGLMQQYGGNSLSLYASRLYCCLFRTRAVTGSLDDIHYNISHWQVSHAASAVTVVIPRVQLLLLLLQERSLVALQGEHGQEGLK